MTKHGCERIAYVVEMFCMLIFIAVSYLCVFAKPCTLNKGKFYYLEIVTIFKYLITLKSANIVLIQKQNITSFTLYLLDVTLVTGKIFSKIL